MNPKASSIEDTSAGRLEANRKTQIHTVGDLEKWPSEANEVISYHMLAFKTSEVITVYYAAAKNISDFNPHSEAIIAFQKGMSPSKTSKGAIQYPIGQPLPLDWSGTFHAV